jgi:hypothetical protein
MPAPRSVVHPDGPFAADSSGVASDYRRISDATISYYVQIDAAVTYGSVTLTKEAGFTPQ